MNSHYRSYADIDVTSYKTALLNKHVNLVYSDNYNLDFSHILSRVIHKFPTDYQFWSINKKNDAVQIRLAESIASVLADETCLSERLMRHIMRLFNFFCEVSGDTEPFISLRVVSANYLKLNYPSVSCCYHRDTAAMTLFQTLYGKGMEWLPNQSVNRAMFENTAIADIDDIVTITQNEDCRSLATSIVGILKGEVDPKNIDERQCEFIRHFIPENEINAYNVGNGLIHRGPLLNDTEMRLVLTITTVRTPNCCEAL